MSAFLFPHGLPDGVSSQEEGSVLRLQAATGAQGAVFLQLAPEAEGACTVEMDILSGADFSPVLLLRSSRPASVAVRVSVGRGARCRLFLAVRGNVACSLLSRCEGEGAACDVGCAFVAEGKERQRLEVTTEFSARAGGGATVLRGVVRDRAHAGAAGTIVIGPKGERTRTHVSERVLLLGSLATVDVVPRLRIASNDVQAGHAAAITTIAPEDLFYLESRGIGEEEARRMLVEGFLWEVIGGIEDSEIRQMIGEAMGLDGMNFES